VPSRWLGVLVSVARALGFIASAWVLLYVAFPLGLALDLPMALNIALAWASGAVLQGLGLSVARSGALLAMGNGAVRVADVCNGVGEWLLLAGAMFAIPQAGWRHRLLGMVTGGLVLSTLNIARISLLLVLRADAPAWFGVTHEQFMPLAVVLAIVGCFFLWLRRLPREMAARR